MEKTLIFGKKCIKCNKFHNHKKPINIYNVDIKTILMFKKDSFDNKYFIAYDTYYSGIIPLYIRLPIRNTIDKCSENSKNMVLLVYGKNILKKYDTIWNSI